MSGRPTNHHDQLRVFSRPDVPNAAPGANEVDSVSLRQGSNLVNNGNTELPTPLIAVHALDFGYEGRPRLFSHLDFTLHAGEKVGILGPNGSGKTTFLHLLMGLVSPTAGTIEIFGQPRQYPQDFRNLPGKIGLLFQDSDDQLFCPTVAEDVAFGPFNLGKSPAEVRQIVRRTLCDLGLEGWEQRITYRLSGGEKRLVALATVLAMDPEILLLDEPTAGLDEAALARVESILARLPQAMIIVSHDRAFLRRLCDRVLSLQHGQFREDKE
ncbi:MAG: energy-coupling factor ABC transporter ATP-binding protein [Thermogutta sp.]